MLSSAPVCNWFNKHCGFTNYLCVFSWGDKLMFHINTDLICLICAQCHLFSDPSSVLASLWFKSSGNYSISKTGLKSHGKDFRDAIHSLYNWLIWTGSGWHCVLCAEVFCLQGDKDRKASTCVCLASRMNHFLCIYYTPVMYCERNCNCAFPLGDKNLTTWQVYGQFEY